MKDMFFSCILILLSIFILSAQEDIIIVENDKPPYSYINKEYVLGKFDYTSHPEFEPTEFMNSGKVIYLNSRTINAFSRMYDFATIYGIELKIISGTRNFSHQKSIWERKWDNKKNQNLTDVNRALNILEFSSMPSSSRHHWGTDIDLNSWENSYFESGKGKEVYEWLVENAAHFGFFQVYTSKDNGRKGYNEEKWHWSYMPLAEKCLRLFNSTVNYDDINGFKGSHLASEVEIIENYVNGIEK